MTDFQPEIFKPEDVGFKVNIIKDRYSEEKQRRIIEKQTRYKIIITTINNRLKLCFNPNDKEPVVCVSIEDIVKTFSFRIAEKTLIKYYSKYWTWEFSIDRLMIWFRPVTNFYC